MRNEEIIEAEPIKIFVDSCVEIGAKEAATEAQTLERYRFRFEQPLIKASKEYYDRESRTYMSTHTVVEYMSRAKYRIESEERRIKQVIHSTTLGLVMETIEVSYVSNHLEKMEAESMILLGNQQYDDLRNMYFLLTRVPTGLQVVRLMFLGYVKTKGLASVEQLQPEKDGSVDPSAYVGALFGVYETFADVCKTVFSQDSGLVASLDQACKEYINSNAVTNRPGPQSPELLTKYIDSLLKKGSKVSDDAELELKLNQVVTIFKYLEDKDSFQTFYRRSLAKRLVNELSTSFDAEQKIISKFKDVCGFDFTHKLARMFNDIELNNELNTQFRTKMTRSLPFDFSAKVFNTAAWPLTMAPYCANFIVPQALTEAVNGYTDFYTDRHKGRKLNWLWQFSKAEVKITLPNNTDPKRMTYMFSVSVFQLAIMQLLNSSSTRTITIQSILDSTKLPYNIIESSLSTFIKSRLVVILDPATKKPTDGTLSSSSLLKLNTAFRSKRLRINLNAPIKADQKKESLETSQAIADSRNILIQATIVRIMKTRKTLSHTMLVTETIAHLTSRFKPTILEIRKGIDTLLEKEFIERASGSKDQYNYLA
ncbi:Cullin-1 [Zancudomyces culisetae]|uniref:Cullin-1 n=1 Tax=Zancudomyces culisetae TaxID=1213189 RepID=A0A1R1PR73_ZANCU|nr:Cullin-1 [Zancudomyces culisetae]|eukprot:OMH83458.1 Cullin-1 [Zancudomyces culisetae]